MQCTHAQTQLDDYIDGELTVDGQYQLAAHLQGCAYCRDEYQQRLSLQQQLRDIPVPPMRPEFVARVSASLGDRGRSHRRGFVTGFGSAVAASVALWFVVTTYLLSPVQNVGLVTVQLVPNEMHKVSLVFNSPQAVQQATMTIELPANVELAGYPGKRTLSWTTNLQQGSNRLRLPVILRDQNAARVVTRITRNGKDKIFYLDLNAADRPSVQLQSSLHTMT